jgi:nitroimidazol reductase NimA-like FMN-containing flavoprotein (pyridoxamine 5'-phosphate oxidase superfamily)
MTATGFDPRTLLADARLGVLATIKADGMPQLSPVTPYYDRDADIIYVSMTEGRAKTANLRRDPRAALEVTSADGWSWATAEHPDWQEYRSVMVSDRRVLMAMSVKRVYGEKIR